MTKPSFYIHAVSDATGDLAQRLAIAASRQFEDVNVEIIRNRMITTEDQMRGIVHEVKRHDGVIIFTITSPHLRQSLLSEAQKEGVVAMDVMGPVLDMLSHYFHTLPSGEPGLQYRATRDYFKRTEAIEFTVRHDEGHELDTIDQADIILLGISRTSKTPLSVYLAYQGYRCANIPLVSGIPLPEKLNQVDPKKLVGLTVSAEKLMQMRSTRLKNLGRSESEDYAQMPHIERELAFSQEIFKQLAVPVVIDVTGKGTEEVAGEIIHQLRL